MATPCAQQIYANPAPPAIAKVQLAAHFKRGINFLSTPSGDLSPADILLELLDLPPQYVDGPTQSGVTSYSDETIPDYLFNASLKDVRSFIETNHRLPSEIFVGSKTLSTGDFAATLAEHVLTAGPVRLRQGRLDFVQYFSTDAKKSFSWPIHPAGFAPDELLALARPHLMQAYRNAELCLDITRAEPGGPLAIVRDTNEGERARYGASLILVRPDQFVAWAGEAADPTALAHAAGRA